MRSFWRFLPLTGLAPKSSPEPRIATSEARLKFAPIDLRSWLVQPAKRNRNHESTRKSFHQIRVH
jgi:hypothetical protein